jgi:L-threonylcarbamoyladenylate synthase
MIDTKPEISLSHYAGEIRQGNVVAFPTETVYGLGADAWNADAVARIFELKGRPPDNPLIVHVNSVEMAATLVSEIPEDARRLMERFWPGPLALILPKRPEVLDIVTAGLPTVAIRMPNHPIPLRLIEEAGPIAAPSANTSGRPSPTRAEHVRQDFGAEVPVIEGGSCQYGLESTVLDLTMRPYTILRPGHVTQSALEQVLRQPVRMVPSLTAETAGSKRHLPGSAGSSMETGGSAGKDMKANIGMSGDTPRSPGMKYTHYSPDARVRWMRPDELPRPVPPETGTLYLMHRIRPGDAPPRGDRDMVHYGEDYTEMGRDLYDRFRMADLKGYSVIAIEPFADSDEAVEALLNRIRKAIGG